MRKHINLWQSLLFSVFHTLFQACESQFPEETDGCWWICDLPTIITQLYGAANHPKNKNQKQTSVACQNYSN